MRRRQKHRNPSESRIIQDDEFVLSNSEAFNIGLGVVVALFITFVASYGAGKASCSTPAA